MSKPPLYFIGGPTASGKTAAALALARPHSGVIINADAMQVYRGLPLLTALPSPEEKAEIPHALFEVFDAAERSSAGRWLTLARVAIEETVQAGRTPIVVGGTGMYFGALLGNLAEIPSIPDEVRASATALYDERGHEAFRALLAQRDPESATRIELNDRQRLIRAYEVVSYTGKTLGQWQAASAAHSIEKDFTVHRQLLMPDRAELYARCDARFLRMMELGALEEVRGLAARHLDADLPAMKILGVPELAAHLRGEISLAEAIAKAQQSTRNYAKRQMTWFRNQWGE
ncbi:MAG TPA: tRNA (adenosine(37)-N6)-dimethylallyltransferase MiaA [Rhodospirillaceae bacterium]|nr:tRNA (adenosine(37)-N6)-dimethylallyltransferase MiaA [Rhodospirillaceae bacterium]